MRVFIAVLVLIFSFQSWAKADDIRDFEIVGISIEDSALDYFSEKDIKKNTKNWNKKKDFTNLENNNYPFFENYYAIDFNFKTRKFEYKIQCLS